MISFRIGPGDSAVLGKYFEPVFEAIDLTKLHNQNIFTSMIINGEKAVPFSASTLRMPDPERDLSPQIIQMSRDRFASRRDLVDADIRSRTDDGEGSANAPGAATNEPERKPNKEFLDALKNPDLPPPVRQPDYRGGDRGGSRSNDRRDRDRARGDNRPRPSSNRAGQGSRV